MVWPDFSESCGYMQYLLRDGGIEYLISDVTCNNNNSQFLYDAILVTDWPVTVLLQ